MSKLKKALQKAKETRETQSTESVVIDAEQKTFQKIKQELELKKKEVVAEQKNNQELEPQIKEISTSNNEKICVEYTKTKVKPIDPETLKRNKVVSLFHDHEMTDQINLLRAQLMGRLKNIKGNSILITSANPGEGKTFTAINLAISIAKELNKTVLLVDADLKNPSIHHYDFAADFLGVNINEGLADYLIGQADLADLLINPGIDKLTILPAGRSMPNSSELLGSPKMEKLIDEVKRKYKDRIVIFDCSSILASPDPLVFSHLVDGILVVVEAEKTTPAQLKKTMSLLNGKQVLGAVMNKNRDKR